MDVNTFSELIKTESSAKRYLLDFCWKNHQRHCPRCNERRLYRLKEGRRRCSRCGYTFHDFSGRFINAGNCDCRQWLWAIKLFELDLPPQLLAAQLGLAGNTATALLMTMRRAILAQALDAPLFLRMGLLQGADETSPPIFGILERKGWVFVDIMQDLSVAGLAHFKNNFHLGTATRGRLVYTDRYRHYETLLFCAASEAQAAPFRSRKLARALYVDSRQGFWTVLLERLRRTRGLPARWFPLHLKELEFRYNQRKEDIFPLLAASLCKFVPNSA